MVSALYAVLGALLLIKFSFDVVRLRTQYHVGYGDGGFSELQVAIRVHGNAVEYLPIGLILLLFVEMNGAQKLDGASWRYPAYRRPVDALLRFPSPALQLASFRHERHLVRAGADGAR
ncbi:Inner membrane protein yecN [Raoultella terrigena]|uniref:Inner membrane protein yecN n=1 Tax=Raoultella terrigena TaxID=577 RepID=A0A3P8KIY8_RAOTE|nr:Inner membrane protein yecN [Raoultella terrigena]